MFPKDHLLRLEELVQLWTSQGYIQSNGKNNSKETGREYAKQLWERSLLEGRYGEKEFHLAGSFKLHDVVHDLARVNSDNECYSIDTSNNAPNFPCEPYHLYVHDPIAPRESLPSVEVTALRTLIITQTPSKVSEDHCHFDFSKAHKLRALALNYLSWFNEWKSGLKVFPSVGNLKHLRYLSIQHWPVPRCLHSLCFLRKLYIEGCDMVELTESFGNLVSLEELVIYQCHKLLKLPTLIGSLTNIQTLKICNTGINSLPPSMNKIVSNIQTFHVRLHCTTIGWLKDFVDMKGTLIVENLHDTDRMDAYQCANLVSMHNLDCLMLHYYRNSQFILSQYASCEKYFSRYTKGNQLQLLISNGGNLILDDEDQALQIAMLQPHSNLRELHINDYSGITFPGWMRDTTSCASLERIVICYCKNIESLPFGGLCKLKYLKIKECCKLRFLGADSLPIQLQELEVDFCLGLICLRGIKKLKSLVKLSIQNCYKLQALIMEAEEPSVQPINKSLHQNSLLGLRNLISLRYLKIKCCDQLKALVDEPRPIESCEIELYDCPGLRDWCSHHSIPYEDFSSHAVRDSGWAICELKSIGIGANSKSPSLQESHFEPSSDLVSLFVKRRDRLMMAATNF